MRSPSLRRTGCPSFADPRGSVCFHSIIEYSKCRRNVHTVYLLTAWYHKYELHGAVYSQKLRSVKYPLVVQTLGFSCRSTKGQDAMVKIRGEPNDIRAVQAFFGTVDKEAKVIRNRPCHMLNKSHWKFLIQSHLLCQHLSQKQEPCLVSVHDSIRVAIWIPKQARPEAQSLNT